MSVPFNIQKATTSFPCPVTAHVALTWRNSVVIWGGSSPPEARRDLSVVYHHSSGEWIRMETRGDVPEHAIQTSVRVIEDQLIMVDANYYNCDTATVHSLDLNNGMWTKHIPSGSPPRKTFLMGTWVHGRKLYCFGGYTQYTQSGGMTYATNQLFCYNSLNNSWEWPLQWGDIPSPRYELLTMISGDKVFLFGGKRATLECYSDLHILDLTSVKWERVQNNNNSSTGKAPKRTHSGFATLTSISGAQFNRTILA